MSACRSGGQPMLTMIEAHPSPPLQPVFTALVDDVRDSLRTHFGVLLDSLYLYGSVSRATAQPGVSDLDVTMVLARPLTAPENDALECLRVALQLRHPEVSKIDFDLGTREEVLDPAHLNSWGYWLKHECRCIYGADLGLQFAPIAPSREVALAVNGDYVQVLGDYAARLAAAQGHDLIHRLQKEAARKLIRATHVLRPLTDSYWPRTLEDYAAYFCQSHPEMAEHIAFFLAHAQAPWATVADFNARLLGFVGWMQRQQLLFAA